MDYQTGELIAYVGSAGLRRRPSDTKRFQPQFDVLGERLPPAGFGVQAVQLRDRHRLRQAHGRHRCSWTSSPTSATTTRPPTPTTSSAAAHASATHCSSRSTSRRSRRCRSTIGHGLPARRRSSGCASAATRATPACRWRSARRRCRRSISSRATARSPTAVGYIGNTTILTVDGPQRRDRASIRTSRPRPTQVISPQAAYITTSILAGNTNRNVNPFWGKFALRGPTRERRPATLKTGTNNDAKDLNAYGYIAAARPASSARTGSTRWSSGAWNGNSDNSEVSTPNDPLFSIDVTTYVWQGFLQETTKDWPIRNFRRPEEGLVRVEIDPFTGYLPQRGDEGYEEWFIVGTEPKNRLPREACGREVLELLAYESKFDNWLEWDRDWLRRARRGPGAVGGPDRTRVTYFYNNGFNPFGRAWGPVMGQDCAEPTPAPSCVPLPSAGCQRRDPVVRAPGAVRRCAGACRLPTRIGDAGAECATERGAVAATRTHARTATPTPTPEPDPTPTPEPTPTDNPGQQGSPAPPPP